MRVGVPTRARMDVNHERQPASVMKHLTSEDDPRMLEAGRERDVVIGEEEAQAGDSVLARLHWTVSWQGLSEKLGCASRDLCESSCRTRAVC